MRFAGIFILFALAFFTSDISGEDRFFFSEYSLLLKRMEEEGSPENKFYLNAVRRQQIEQDWTYPELPPDYYSHQIPELNYLPMEQAQLRRAYSHYENAVILMNEMREELKAMDEKIRSVPQGIWWKMIDETDALERHRHRLKMKYSAKLALTAGKTIEILEKIQNSKVRGEKAYLILYYQSLRMLSVYEVIMFNYDTAFHSLMKYRINPDSDLEWPYHHLLSRCYDYKFKLSRKSTRIPEEEIRELRKMKNIHYLIAIGLKYGYKSDAYSYAREKVRLEELGSPRSTEDR